APEPGGGRPHPRGAGTRPARGRIRGPSPPPGGGGLGGDARRAGRPLPGVGRRGGVSAGRAPRRSPMAELERRHPAGPGARRLQRRVPSVAGCARALFQAHLNALTQDPALFGPPRDDVHRALGEEFSAADPVRQAALWDRFVRLVRRRLGGAAIQGDKLVFFKPHPRDIPGPGRSVLPEIFPVARRLLEGPVPPLVLRDLYRRDLVRRFRLRDTPAFLRFGLHWLERFNRLDHRVATRAELLDLAAPARGREGWVAGLIEVLEFLSILRCPYRVSTGKPRKDEDFDPHRHGPRPYVIHQKADPPLVLNNLFGRSTGVSGLDYLLSGGLWVPGGRRGAENLAVAVSGGPGLGKSTLAMGIAAQVAARGGLALYLHFQLDSRSVQRQLSQFHRRLLPFFR